jgi:hypothetical protein
MKQDTNDQNNQQVPWNKGELIRQKSPLKLKEIWEIRSQSKRHELIYRSALSSRNLEPSAIPKQRNNTVNSTYEIVSSVIGRNLSHNATLNQ